MDRDIEANLKAITDMVGIFSSSINKPLSLTEIPQSMIERRISLFTEGIILLILHYANKENSKAYIEAFKQNNYTIDKEGNVLIKEKEKNSLFTPKELIEVLKREKEQTYEFLFQYTKFKDPIRTPISLEEYLKQVKTFQVSLTSRKTEENKEKVAKETERKVKNLFALQKEVKVQDLMNSYLSLLPPTSNGTVKKAQFLNLGRNYFYTRIKNLEIDFYSLSLKEQQVLLNTWFFEYQNSIDYQILAIGQILLNLDKQESITPSINSLIGLILLYGRMLSQIEHLDYDNISLSEIEIKMYDSLSIQEKKEKISSLQIEIDKLRRKSTLEDVKKQTYLEEQKRELDKSIKEAILTSQLEIATNNNLKMKEIIDHIRNGVVLMNQENVLQIKSINPHTGKIMFEASIPLYSFLEIMKCIEGKLLYPKPGIK